MTIVQDQALKERVKMTDAKTEAQRIVEEVQWDMGMTTSEMSDLETRIAAALAEKDAEMAKLELERDRWERRACTSDDVLARTRSKLERAEAKLAKAKKALVALDFLIEARKALVALERMDRGVDWCDQDEQARRWAAARRALEGGKIDG